MFINWILSMHLISNHDDLVWSFTIQIFCCLTGKQSTKWAPLSFIPHHIVDSQHIKTHWEHWMIFKFKPPPPKKTQKELNILYHSVVKVNETSTSETV